MHITGLFHLKYLTNWGHFVALWVVCALTKRLHFWMDLSHFRVESKLPYLIWKRIFKAFIWSELAKMLVKHACYGPIIPLDMSPLYMLSLKWQINEDWKTHPNEILNVVQCSWTNPAFIQHKSTFCQQLLNGEHVQGSPDATIMVFLRPGICPIVIKLSLLSLQSWSIYWEGPTASHVICEVWNLMLTKK